jgi:hypothetical protein
MTRPLALLFLFSACAADPSPSPDSAAADGGRGDGGASLDAPAAADGSSLDAELASDAADAEPADSAAVPDGATSPSATITDECGVGPFERREFPEKPCAADPAPECPQTPEAGAVPVTIVATCAYGRGETGCEPLLAPACPDLDGDFFDFNLTHPTADAGFGCWGRVHLVVEPNATGGVHVDYAGFALDHGDCSDVGTVEGELDVPSMCCERTIDLHFPHGDFTFRIAVRVDWTMPAT